MGLSKICWRPLSGVVRMRVVKTYNVQPLLSRLSLNSDQLFGIDVIAVPGPIITRIATSHYLLRSAIVLLETAQQHAAALVRIRLFAVTAKRFEFGLPDDQHKLPKSKTHSGWPSGLALQGILDSQVRRHSPEQDALLQQQQQQGRFWHTANIILSVVRGRDDVKSGHRFSSISARLSRLRIDAAQGSENPAEEPGSAHSCPVGADPVWNLSVRFGAVNCSPSEFAWFP